MGAVAMWSRWVRRRSWRATLFLAVLAGVAAAVVMTSVGVARRTSTSVERYMSQPDLASTLLTVCPIGITPDNVGDDPGTTCGRTEDLAEPLEQVRQADGVRHAARTAVTVNGLRSRDGPDWKVTIGYALIDDWPGLPTQPLVVSGRLPAADAPDEVVVNERVAEQLGVAVGDPIDVGLYTAEQRDAAASGVPPEPEGGVVAARLVGVVRTPDDLQSIADGALSTGPGWWRSHGGDDLASYGKGIAVAFDGPVARNDFVAASGDLLAPRLSVPDTLLETAGPVDRTIDLQVAATLVVAAAAFVAAMAFVGQSLRRMAERDLVDRPALTAMGLTRNELVQAMMLRVLPVALGASTLAVVVTVAASPVGPIGLARRIEVEPGWTVDPWVVVIGGVATAVLIVAGTAVATWMTLRSAVVRPRPLLIPPGWVPVTARAGLALLRRRDRAVAGAIIATAIALAGVTFAFGVDASHRSLMARPERYGQTWDRIVGNYASQAEIDRGEATLDSLDGVGDVDSVRTAEVLVDGRATTVMAFSRPGGHIGPQIVEGRAPEDDREVALGARTMAEAGVRVGDEVQVVRDTDGTSMGALRVVGSVLVNDGVTSTLRIDDGALVTAEEFERIDPTVGSNLLVTAAPGISSRELDRELAGPFGPSLARPAPPDDVANLDRVALAPVVLAVLIAALALAALVNATVTVVRQRRRDVGILRSMGCTRGQVMSAHLSIAVMVAAVAVAVGLPLGLVLARWGWSAVNSIAGTDSPATVPWVGMAVASVLGLLTAAVVMAPSAARAAGTSPAVALRSE